MTIFLVFIPFLLILTALFLYRHNGKKEFFKFDLVQFIYAFVISPIMFVWLKSFLFFLLKKELNLNLSLNEIFTIDSIYSIIGLFIYAFVVIHSLTKSFELKKSHDSFYDLFKDSEFFHLWISHIILYFGLMILSTFLSIINLYIPLDIQGNKTLFYGLLVWGLVVGLSSFLGVWLSNFSNKFMKLMKFLIAIFFTIHALVYFIWLPDFNFNYSVYWFLSSVYLSLVICALFFEKTEKKISFFDKLHYKFHWKKKIKK